jgi:hypothetical protein
VKGKESIRIEFGHIYVRGLAGKDPVGEKRTESPGQGQSMAIEPPSKIIAVGLEIQWVGSRGGEILVNYNSNSINKLT